ncbi:MAG: tetratricopeptide repeat protein [Bacteroidetes bacterium]|nr:tetratricopeptide repeat protein [Bacteroidota bacterium]
MRKFPLLFITAVFAMLSVSASGQTSDDSRTTVDSAALLGMTRHRVDTLTLAIQKTQDRKSLINLYVKRGLGEDILGHPDSAIYDYYAAIQLNPNLPNIYIYRSAALQHIKKYAYAVGDLQMAISLLPNDPMRASTLYTRVSYLYRVLGSYHQALKDDSAAIALNPNNGLAYISSGWTHLALQEYGKAIEAFDAGIPLTPTAPPAALAENLFARADAKKALKKYKGAISDYLQALKIKPDNRNAHWNLAACYNYNGDYELADAEYTKTITYTAGDNTNLIKLYFDRAKMEIAEQKYKEALRDDSLILTFGKNARAYWGMADAYSSMGNFQESIRWYNETIKLYDDNDYNKAALSLLNNDIADADYFLAKYDEMVHAATKAIGYNAQAWSAYLNRGRAYLRLSKNDKAAEDFKKVLTLDTTRAFAYAFALFYTGNADKAIEVMQKNAVNTTDPALLISHYYNLACLYSLMNKTDESNAYLKKCLDLGYSRRYAQLDPDLENIRNTPDFNAMMTAK